MSRLLPPILSAALMFIMLWVWASSGSALVSSNEADVLATDSVPATTNPISTSSSPPTSTMLSTTTRLPTTTVPLATTSTTSTTTPTTSSTTTTPANPTALVVASGMSGHGPGPGVHTYSVEVEAATGFDADEIADFIDGVLADPRSWRASGTVSFGRTDSEVPPGGFRIIVASPSTVDRLCAPLRTNGYFSCRNGDRVVLNAERWTNAVENWDTSLVAYRQYLVNHEVGHAIGMGHQDCPGIGQLAPVMMQQSKTIGECAPNSWPFPNPA